MLNFLSNIATAIAIVKSNIPLVFAVVLLCIDRSLFIIYSGVCVAYGAGLLAGLNAAPEDLLGSELANRPTEWLLGDPDVE